MNTGASDGSWPSASASSAVRDQPQATLAFERRVELIGAKGGIGDVSVAIGIEPQRVDQDDRSAADPLEQRSLAGIDLAEDLAMIVEPDQLGAQAGRILDHLPLGVDEGRRAREREDRAGRELTGGDRQDRHAQWCGQCCFGCARTP
jgi:hypothetical protein